MVSRHPPGWTRRVRPPPATPARPGPAGPAVRRGLVSASTSCV